MKTLYQYATKYKKQYEKDSMKDEQNNEEVVLANKVPIKEGNKKQ